MAKLKPNAIYVVKSQKQWDFLRDMCKAQTLYPAKGYTTYEELRRACKPFRAKCLARDDYPAITTNKDCEASGFCRLSWYKDIERYSLLEYIEVSELIKGEEKEKNMKEKRICAICGEVINEDDDYMTNDNGEHLCESCRNDGYEMCEDCGRFTDDLIPVDNDRYVCNTCLNRNYERCECCENYYYFQDVYETYNGNYVCDDCRDRRYVTCEDCGRVVHEDDYRSSNDCCYCPDCYDENYDGPISDYHSHCVSAYYNDNGVTNKNDFEGGYGFELEVDDGFGDQECARELEDLLGSRAWFERDGSLNNEGFEIITAPHTRLAMERDFPFDKMIDILREHDYKSHNSGHCGLHVHVSRSLFGNDENERVENVAKVILFYEIFWDDLVKVSRRKHFGYCYKMSSDNEDDIDETKAKEIAKESDGGSYNRNRYYSINLQNTNTIEFRLMRGTLNKDTLKATLDFTMTIVENCKNVPMDKVNDKDLWLQGLKQETINYLKKRGAFGYEEDTYDTENE